MDHDRQRAALAIACVCAVVLGATLFPAAGFGSNPVPGATGGSGPGVDVGPGSDDGAEDGPKAVETQADDSERDTDSETSTAGTEGDSATSDREASTAAGPGEGEATTTVASDGDSNAASTTVVGDPGVAGEGGLLGSLLAILVILAAGLLGLIGTATGLGRHHRRRYPGQWSLPDAPHLRVLAYVRRIPQTSLSFVLFAGRTAPNVLERLAGGVSRATNGIGAATDALGSVGRVLGRGAFAIPRGLVAGLGGLSRGVTAAVFGLPAAFSGLGAGGLFGRGSAEPGDDPRLGGGEESEGSDATPREPPGSVREAWQRLQSDLGVGGDDGRTPGQIARRAVARGVPRAPIRSLTRAFRDVRYGGYPDDGERVTTAREAYDRIRNALDGDSS